jgi:hypothetical protein
MENGMREVSTFRLYVMRAAYALVFVGLATGIWPLLMRAPHGVEHMRGVVWSVLTAVSLLAVFGIRYPLRMLPLLLFELIWKVVWLAAVGAPLWAGNRLAGPNLETWWECWFGVVVVVAAIPWGYVVRKYFREAGDPWVQPRSAVPQPSAAASL